MAATHNGHCQICGRQHKVTGSRIAKHGYTIRHGWQEGACYGSGGKPFEISCDLIEGAIVAAKRYIENTGTLIARLQVEPLDEDGKTGAFLTKEGLTTYHIVTIHMNDQNKVELRGGYGDRVLKTYPNTGYNAVKTVEEVARKLADTRIKYLTGTIGQSEESIAYLEERKKGWKPAELQPVTDEDKAKSAPKLHFEATRWDYNTTACSHSAQAASTNRSRIKTKDLAKVTCTACLRSIKEAAEAPARRRAARIKALTASIKYAKKSLISEKDPQAIAYLTDMLAKDEPELAKLVAEAAAAETQA